MNGTLIDVVQAQVDAFNLRDLDAFLSTYDDYAEVFSMPTGNILACDKAALADLYAEAFAAEGVVEIVGRLVVSDKVVDHERLLAGNECHEAIAVYEIREGLIQRVWLFEVSPWKPT